MLILTESPPTVETIDMREVSYRMPIAQGHDGQCVDQELTLIWEHWRRSEYLSRHALEHDDDLASPFHFDRQIDVSFQHMGRLVLPPLDVSDDDEW